MAILNQTLRVFSLVLVLSSTLLSGCAMEFNRKAPARTEAKRDTASPVPPDAPAESRFHSGFGSQGGSADPRTAGDRTISGVSFGGDQGRLKGNGSKFTLWGG